MCDVCGRHFARRGQSHECSPALSLDAYFATALSHEQPVFEAVHGHLVTIGPVHVEPVAVGIFIKKTGTFMELRPMSKWVAASFPLPRPVTHRLMTRRPMTVGRRIYHVLNLRVPGDLTDDVRDLMTQSYDFVD